MKRLFSCTADTQIIGILYFLGSMMSKRGLLLCNLARQGINASSSEKQVFNKEDCSEIGHKSCEVIPQQDKDKHNEKGTKT